LGWISALDHSQAPGEQGENLSLRAWAVAVQQSAPAGKDMLVIGASLGIEDGMHQPERHSFLAVTVDLERHGISSLRQL
jgi:hypothetical protein